MPHRIAVVGAGFAGLAASTLLARDGHRVTLFEKFDEPRAVGAGILIQPSGLAAMKRLGIYEEIVGRGQPVDWLLGVTPRGRAVIDIHYGDWKADAFGLGLHRGVLFEALWNAAQSAGMSVQTGVEVNGLSALMREFDCVVIADGSHSTLRAQTGLPYRAQMYPWGAVWAVLPDPERRYGRTLWQWYRGAHQMLGIMPTGRLPASAPESETPVVSLFWSLHSSAIDTWIANGLGAGKAQVLALNPACAELLEHVTSIDQLTWARYWDVSMPRYHTNRIVVIGDAAHATSPQLGQGTNLALLDAVALSDALVQPMSITSALEHYTRSRKQHTHFYGSASRFLTPWFQSHGGVLPWLRDQFLAWSNHLPFAGSLNRQTLVGTRTGWFGGQMRLDEVERRQR